MRILGRIFKDELSSKDLWSGLITIIVIILSYIYTPALGAWSSTNLKNIYNSHPVVYNIAFLLFSFFCSYLIYSVVKVLFINQHKKYYYLEEMYSKYVFFLQNAKQVYIFGGDLDFLLKNNKQYQYIKKLKHNCKILCDKLDFNKNKELYKVFNELKNEGVQIRAYGKRVSEKVVGFRGQIKIDDKSSMTGLFCTRKSKERFHIIDINHQYLLDLLYKEFNQSFDSGENVFVKYILFDLGGVFFDGDFHKDFLNYINKTFNIKIKIKMNRKHKLVLDKDLNLGRCNIVDWVEKQIGKKLSSDQVKEIESKWCQVWSPNNDMLELVKQLSKKYHVSVISNLDKQNGDFYLENGYLSCFMDPLFLSYQCKLLKPDKKFWEKVCVDLQAVPGQILLIDDHEENINKARDFGFNVIKFCNDNENVEDLVRRMANINVFAEER